jgi:hypothetical protein
MRAPLDIFIEEETEKEPALDESDIEWGEDNLSGDEDSFVFDEDNRLLHGGPPEEDVLYYYPFGEPREEVFNEPLEEPTESDDLQPLLENLANSLWAEEPVEDDPWNSIGGESKSDK